MNHHDRGERKVTGEHGPDSRWRRMITTAACVALASMLVGCTRGARVSIVSVGSPLELSPSLPTYGFTPGPSNAVDIYMTDLPAEALDPSSELGSAAGHMIHIHMFLAPRAGKTPIEDSGCSVTIRHVVLVDGEIGVYGGGGFLLPRSRSDESEFVGSISDGSMTLLDSTAGFHDALGASRFSASLRVPRDLAASKLIGTRIEDAMIEARSRSARRGP